MYKNYFILNRFILEAGKELRNQKALTAFSQEKDKIIFHFSGKDEDKFLEISVNPGFAYINIRKSFHRAKKNTIDFFSSYFPAEFISFSIADNDRIIKLSLGTADIYFAVRGKFTNVHLIGKENELISFKKNINEDSFLNEIKQVKFISQFNHIDFKTGTGIFKEEIKKNYPVVGNEIILETETRAGEVSFEDKTSMLKNIINEIAVEKPAVFVDEPGSNLHLAVETFTSLPFTDLVTFDSLLPALNYFIIKKYSLEASGSKEKIIKKHLDRELKKLSDKLNNLKSRIERGSKEEEYNKIGNLLLINRHSLYKGMKTIEAEDIYNGQKLLIKLDDKLSPQKNIDLYFDKAKSEKINYEKSKQLFESVKNEYDRLNNIENRLSKIDNPEDYKTVMKELKIKENVDQQSEKDLKEKFKQYLIGGKYSLFVGKDSRNNDLLTTKFAKQNDYWFHARSVSGSHAVLKAENPKEAVPKDVLKKAAAIAAYHSKAKTAGMVPVSYVLKKYVVKKKGMEPGKVALMKEEVLIVKPEIPAGCEYVSNE